MEKHWQGKLLEFPTHERRARARADLATARMQSLQSLTLALSGALTPEDVARAVVEEAVRAMPADAGILFLLDAAGTTLELAHAVRYESALLPALARVPLTVRMPITEAALSGAPIWQTGPGLVKQDAPELAALIHSVHPGSYSSAALPLSPRGRVVGVLALTWLESRGFDVEERAFMDMLAQQAAMALERARLLAAERRQAERTVLLQHATATLATSLDAGQSLRGVALALVPSLGDFCIIDVRGPDMVVRRTFHALTPESAARLAASRWHPAEGGRASVWALDSGQPAFHPHVDAAWAEDGEGAESQRALLRALAPCSWLSVPLTTPEGVLGSLTLGHSLSGRHHTEEDLALALELARRATAAVQNAHLFHQTQQALQLRDDFLAIASHELNTPLTSLKLQLARLQRGSEDEFVRTRASAAVQQVDRLGRLVRELLEVSRLSEGRLHLDPEPVELVELCREVLGRFGDEMARAGTAVHLDAPAAVSGRWDRARVDGVVMHLVSNALKYGQGHPVELVVTDAPGDLARLVVRDRGIGIPPEQQAHLFQRFGRAVPLRHYGGFGLGLWFSRQVVEAHGGRIHLESAPGEGTTVTVELPREPAPG
ncbi:GAF domain-containing protein [Pyxidicoccus parkwayensis]|uniref:histidine kinase n=1 Tax=Pyxidicoccus parkwayensis TaxID=2813578 RepID=A0ABX7NRT9_9BACT|nr:GAF domain-containing sensor histidine kinase [Pyxidicoccus parkwaysis]QSQ21611.1 GAF domain-containing protein [Pyxidicoccus parkwaysis]